VDYEAAVAATAPLDGLPSIDENSVLTINYTSGTTSRPKGVMMTHRNAWMNSIGTLVHVPMTAARPLSVDAAMFHANGWTFSVDRDGGRRHACVSEESRAGWRLRSRSARERSPCCARRRQC
jgi:fatty-acyl-CoA synthase